MKPLTKHIMIDLETLGVTQECAVLSLGAVLFDKEKIINEEYHIFNLIEQKNKRLIDPATVSWWMKQHSNAREVFEKCNKEGQSLSIIPKVLERIKGNENWDNVKIWGNGTDFDTAIIEHIYAQLNEPTPWKYWNRLCYRTFKYVFGINSKPPQSEAHNALVDARFQAQCVINHYKGMRK